MHVGVLGGGLQGCCIALALAARGARVTLFDRNDVLLSRTAIANEGKVHLGYMYAGDPTLSTAKMMMTGALAFAPFLESHLGKPARSFLVSVPAIYVVHRKSQANTEDCCQYFKTVHALVNEAADERRDAYFGRDLSVPLRLLSAAEKEEAFNPQIAVAAVASPEIAINPVALARSLRDCVNSHPHIEVRCNHTVTGAKDERNGLYVFSNRREGGAVADRFDHVVNALWEGRLALNEGLGHKTNRPWLHRLKYGVSFRLPADVAPPASATFVLGPFGEVVTYGDGQIYLMWYPECLQAISAELTPPAWETYPQDPIRSLIIGETLRALAAIVPALARSTLTSFPKRRSKVALSSHGARPTFAIPIANYIADSRSALPAKAVFTRSIPASLLWHHTSQRSAPSA